MGFRHGKQKVNPGPLDYGVLSVIYMWLKAAELLTCVDLVIWFCVEEYFLPTIWNALVAASDTAASVAFV